METYAMGFGVHQWRGAQRVHALLFYLRLC